MTALESGIRPDPAQPVPPTGRSRTGHPARVAGVVLTSLALLAVAVWPQLSARFTGDEVVLRVQPVDPIDPFRGAYVDLGYPDLPCQQFDEVNPVTEESSRPLTPNAASPTCSRASRRSGSVARSCARRRCWEG